MLTSTEKYNHSLKLRNAISAKKDADDTIKAETAILAAYVDETGDKIFRWKSGLTLTYVSGSPAKETVDAKAFMEFARRYMDADDYEACIAKATTTSAPRKAHFR